MLVESPDMVGSCFVTPSMRVYVGIDVERLELEHIRKYTHFHPFRADYVVVLVLSFPEENARSPELV